jgi:hypothetical protein
MLLRAQTCENRPLVLRPIRLVYRLLGSEVAATSGLQFRPRGYESLADDFDVRPGPVSSGAALLPRPTEGKPVFA